MEENINNIPPQSPEDEVWWWCSKLWVTIKELEEFWWQSYRKDWCIVTNEYYVPDVWNNFLSLKQRKIDDKNNDNNWDFWFNVNKYRNSIVSILTLDPSAKESEAKFALDELEIWLNFNEQELFARILEFTENSENRRDVKEVIDWMKYLEKSNVILYVKLCKFMYKNLVLWKKSLEWCVNFIMMISESVDYLAWEPWSHRKIKWKKQYYSRPESCFSYVQSFTLYRTNNKSKSSTNSMWQHYDWQDIYNND